MISLVIKGDYNQAVNAAMRHDVTVGSLRSYKTWNYTIAEADDLYLPEIIKWYNADLTLLLYSQKEPIT